MNTEVSVDTHTQTLEPASPAEVAEKPKANPLVKIVAIVTPLLSFEVKNNQTIKVEQNRALTFASGNKSVTIKRGTRDVKVQSNENHANADNFDHNVSGSYTLKVNGNITIDASGIVKISG